MRVAVTGGIASGKSTVIREIGKLGFPVFSADGIARGMYDDPALREKVLSAFPEAEENGAVSRTKLAASVFSDEGKRRRLNALTHPYIMETMARQMEEAEGTLLFAEVPLLFESGYEKEFDRVVVVLRNREERILSIAARDDLDREEAEKRIRAQFDYDAAGFEDYYVLHNDGNLGDLKEKTRVLARKLSEECGRITPDSRVS